MKSVLGLLILLLCQPCFAGNAWYWGKVTKIITFQSDGSFMAYIENSNVHNICENKRVRFMVSNLGLERTKAAMSMALSAFHSNKNFGVVLDLPSSPNSVCEVPASASQGAGISN